MRIWLTCIGEAHLAKRVSQSWFMSKLIMSNFQQTMAAKESVTSINEAILVTIFSKKLVYDVYKKVLRKCDVS